MSNEQTYCFPGAGMNDGRRTYYIFLYCFVNVNGKVLQQRVWDMVHRGPLLVTTRAISLLNGVRNRQLGLFHPYKWSYGPLLITGRGPPCMCFELQVLRLTRRFFEPM